MNFLIFLQILFFSFVAFSQSYLIMENGLVITTDTSGFAYDLGHWAYPNKVTLKGGQYFVEEGNILATIDENGLLFRKYELISEKIKGKGINYFLSEEGVVSMIDKNGLIHHTSSEVFQRAAKFGGNYFSVLSNTEVNFVEIYAVTSDGQIKKAELGTIKMNDIVTYGGIYFMSNRGVVFTVSDNGEVLSQETQRVGLIRKRGGNYFIDSSGLFFSVSHKGELRLPVLPASLRVNSIQRLGSNYFIDQQGRLFVVDKQGEVFERPMRDNDLRLAKIISL
jgi:hypothetical protein